jgi:hypothetical protein
MNFTFKQEKRMQKSGGGRVYGSEMHKYKEK